jgi:GNAT superfamily N-acetyltransferase
MPAAVLDLTLQLPPGAREFLPEEEDRAAWARLHEFRLAMHAELEPDDAAEPDAVAEAALKRLDPFYDRRLLVLERGGRIVSSLRMSAVRPDSPEYEGNQHQIWAEVNVLAGERRRHIAQGWLPAIVAYAESRGARLVSGHSETDSGHAFARRLGAEPRIEEWESRLWLDRADWDRLREWAALDPGDYRIERYEPFPPEAIWDDYARGYTELERNVPRENLETGDWILTPERMRVHRERQREQHRTLHVIVAWDREGMAAVTELVYAEHDPTMLEQELTAVHPRARGRGLAKLLKARLLLELRERYPTVRYVRTWNALSNDPMWGINRAMGFERYRHGTGYQVEVSKLRG